MAKHRSEANLVAPDEYANGQVRYRGQMTLTGPRGKKTTTYPGST